MILRADELSARKRLGCYSPTLLLEHDGQSGVVTKKRSIHVSELHARHFELHEEPPAKVEMRQKFQGSLRILSASEASVAMRPRTETA